jgi:hypothetical protein
MEANTFHLKNNNEKTQITYLAQGNAGQPVLTYKDPVIDKTFQAAEIRALTADIGQLLTVTLEQGVDQGTKMLTLLLPTVTVVQPKTAVDVKGEAIVTTFPKVAGSNTPGANEIYRVESLHGRAAFDLVQT